MKFHRWTKIWWTDFGTPDISLGIHVCWSGRIDLHIWTGMLSLGKIPLYKDQKGRIFAASNSYHQDKTKPIRAGTP